MRVLLLLLSLFTLQVWANDVESDYTKLNWGVDAIHAKEAKKLTRARERIVVAVIDTGVDSTHDEFLPNFILPYGKNFVFPLSRPTDFVGHGTHVSGIIKAVAGPDSAAILPIKFYSEGSSGAVNLSNLIRGIYYAIDNGARVINISGGGKTYSKAEYLAVKRAEEVGILVVTAAGNENMKVDLTNNYYPAGHGTSNIISVSATTRRGTLVESSDWGPTISLAAPGEDIYSTIPGDSYGYMSGTSQATAFVSGAAALLLSDSPFLKFQDLKMAILNSVYRTSALRTKVMTGGQLDLLEAVKNLKRIKPYANETNVILYE